VAFCRCFSGPRRSIDGRNRRFSPREASFPARFLIGIRSGEIAVMRPSDWGELLIFLQSALIRFSKTWHALRMIRNDSINLRRSAAQFFIGNIALAPLDFYRLRVDPSSTGTSKEND
jgi:hypothetical protein